MCDRIRRAGLNAISTKDAAVVIDVVHLGVALGTTDPIGFSILSGFNVNAVRWTRRRAQEACHTLLQAVLVALEHVHAAKALLKHGSAVRPGPVGIVLNLRWLEHLPEGDAHAFGDRSDVFHDSHKPKQYTN